MASWLHANGDRGVWPRTVYGDGLTPPDAFPPLRGRTRADLCVIGAGITGLSAALAAAQAGMSVTVLEAQRVGWGASGRNGGQVGSGFNWGQKKLERRLGRARAHALWDLAEEAKALTHAAALAHGADWLPGILSVGTAREAAGMAEDAAWMNAEYGTALEVLDGPAVARAIGTTAYGGGVLDRSAGHCNPLLYVFGLVRNCLASGVTIHERSAVHTLRGTEAATESGAVTARFVMQAVGGYPGPLDRVAARVLPINNYIAVTAPLADGPIPDGFAVADSRFVVNYFRPLPCGRLLFGGGESYGKRFPRDIEAKVRRNLARVYPQLAEVAFDHAWGGTLGVTPTRLPLLAEVAPGVFAAGGYSGHGLALSGLFGRLAVEAMGGARARFDLMAGLPVPGLPGGRLFGGLAAQAGMWAGAMWDRV